MDKIWEEARASRVAADAAREKVRALALSGASAGRIARAARRAAEAADEALMARRAARHETAAARRAVGL